jgi:hypothetical protein
MRRSLLPRRAACATAAAIAITVIGTAAPSVAQPSTPHRAATSHAGAKRITVRIHDARGDLVTKTTTNVDDIDSSTDGFKPGKGTVVPPTYADKAMDLSNVTYRIVRVGKTPSLKVTYRVAGPFAYAHHESWSSDTAYAESYDLDALETVLGGGRYTLELVSDGRRSDNGLFVNNYEHDQVACHGVRSTMKVGTRTATQTVPLSCLTDLEVKASKLRAVSAHEVIDIKGTITGTGEDEDIDQTASVSIATDAVSATKRLPLTRTRR